MGFVLLGLVFASAVLLSFAWMANDAEPDEINEKPRRSWCEFAAAAVVHVAFGAQRVWLADFWRTWHMGHTRSPWGLGPDYWKAPIYGAFPAVVAAVMFFGFEPRPMLYLPSYLAGVGVWILLVHMGVIQEQPCWTERLVSVVGSGVLIWLVLPLFSRVPREIGDLEL